MREKFEEIARELEDTGYKNGAAQTRAFAGSLVDAGDAPPTMHFANISVSQPNPRRVEDDDPSQPALFDMNEVLREAYMEAKIRTLRVEFESFDPHVEVIPSRGLKPHILSPRFAYTLRQLFGGNALPDTEISSILNTEEFKKTFEDNQRQKFKALVGYLNRENISTVGDLRNASLPDLINVFRIGDRGAVFFQTAFKPFLTRRTA